ARGYQPASTAPIPVDGIRDVGPIAVTLEPIEIDYCEGVVLHASDHSPVADAWITTPTRDAMSNAEGRFAFPRPVPAIADLRIDADGLASVILSGLDVSRMREPITILMAEP